MAIRRWSQLTSKVGREWSEVRCTGKKGSPADDASVWLVICGHRHWRGQNCFHGPEASCSWGGVNCGDLCLEIQTLESEEWLCVTPTLDGHYPASGNQNCEFWSAGVVSVEVGIGATSYRVVGLCGFGSTGIPQPSVGNFRVLRLSWMINSNSWATEQSACRRSESTQLKSRRWRVNCGLVLHRHWTGIIHQVNIKSVWIVCRCEELWVWRLELELQAVRNWEHRNFCALSVWVYRVVAVQLGDEGPTLEWINERAACRSECTPICNHGGDHSLVAVTTRWSDIAGSRRQQFSETW